MHLLIGIIAASAAGRSPSILASPTNLTAAAWSPTGVTKGANSLTETATTGGHSVGQNGFAFTAGQSWALEVEAAPNGANCIQLAFNVAAFGALAFANFNLAAGAAGTVGAGLGSATVTALDGGFHLCRIIATTSASASASAGIISFCQGDSPSSARLASYLGSTSRSLLIRRAEQFPL